jgi:hypothetical protein
MPFHLDGKVILPTGPMPYRIGRTRALIDSLEYS